MEREWDEAPEPTKISFGDKVETPTGEIGTVTELDGTEYNVVSKSTDLGWFTREELTLVK